MKGFILALQFFTRIPVPVAVDFSEKNIRRCFYFLPLVGLLYGAVIFLPLYFIADRMLAGLCAVIIYVVFGGSLHIDGLADCADAFGSHGNGEKMLAVMSDPHNGTFGTVAVVLDLFSRFVLYQYIPMIDALLPSFLARVCVLYTIAYAKPAKQTGLGALFHSAISKKAFPIFFILTMAGTIAYSLVYGRLILIALPIISFAVTVLFTLFTIKKIGGTTGDVNGAIIELVEIANLAALALS